MRVYRGYRTPSAALHWLTRPKAPYRWWGLVVGRWFIGFMRSEAE